MRLLENLTGNTTGSEPFIRNDNGGSFMLAIPAAASLGGGTLVIQFSDLNDVILTTSTELSFSALPEPKLIFLPSGIKIRAQLSGATAPSIAFFDLIPADQADKNYGANRI